MRLDYVETLKKKAALNRMFGGPFRMQSPLSDSEVDTIPSE
jgi:hypothetical protein